MRLILRPIMAFTRYKVPYNINRQQHRDYLKKVERAQIDLNQNQKSTLIPRRKRRLYDRPKVDRNIEGYGAWRIFDPEEVIQKINEHSMVVERKIQIAPKWLIHAFGIGCLPDANPKSSHRQYHFEDNRLNRYLLYEYRNTTHYQQNVQGFDYQNQEHIHPRQRIIKRPTPEEFWQSEQLYEFRLNTTVYAEKFKFQAWLLQEIEKRKTQKSFDEYIDQKFGKIVTYNKKEDSTKFEPYKPMVTSVTPEHFNPPKKGKQPQPPKVQISKKLDQTFRILNKSSQKQKQEAVKQK